MIRNFEGLTYELTHEELLMLDKIVKLFKDFPYIGREKAITNARLRNYLVHQGFKKPAEVRVRKIIHNIRVEGRISLLLSNSKGYFIASNETEILSTIESLEQKARSIQQAAEAIRSQYLNSQFPDRSNRPLPYGKGL